MPVQYLPQNLVLGLSVIGVKGLKAPWAIWTRGLFLRNLQNPHGGCAVWSCRASRGFGPFGPPMAMRAGMDGGKGDASSVLGKEISYCFSLDR